MEERRVGSAAVRSWLLLLGVAVLMLFIGFAVGRVVTLRQFAAESEANLSAAADTPAEPFPPTSDAPGQDIEGLPRYPGSIRIEYRQEVINNLLETEVEYLVSAELEAVRDFYRTLFEGGGWRVADLGIYDGEWRFFVISGGREALVELEIENGLVEIELETSEPEGVASNE